MLTTPEPKAVEDPIVTVPGEIVVPVIDPSVKPPEKVLFPERVQLPVTITAPLAEPPLSTILPEKVPAEELLMVRVSVIFVVPNASVPLPDPKLSMTILLPFVANVKEDGMVSIEGVNKN